MGATDGSRIAAAGLEWYDSGVKTELQKMLAGELYEPNDAELVRMREHARDVCWATGASGMAEPARWNRARRSGETGIWSQRPPRWASPVQKSYQVPGGK